MSNISVSQIPSLGDPEKCPTSLCCGHGCVKSGASHLHCIGIPLPSYEVQREATHGARHPRRVSNCGTGSHGTSKVKTSKQLELSVP